MSQMGQKAIIFNNMLTNILKNKTKNKIRHENVYKNDTPHQKTTFLQFEEPNYNNEDTCEYFPHKKIEKILLPPIYKTQTLIPRTNKARKSVFDHMHERQSHRLTIVKLQKLSNKENPYEKQNIRTRALTDERQNIRQGVDCKIYHNFVNQKKNKKVNHMSKIIEKVLSEDIEPWNLQNSNISKNVGQKFKEFNKNIMKYKFGEYSCQKYVLSDYNSIIYPK